MATPPALSAADRAVIAAAVTAGEAHTSGEIVPVLAAISDEYADVALIWAALVALAGLAAMSLAPQFFLGLADRVVGWNDWGAWSPGGILSLAACVAMVKFAAVWAVLHWRRLRLALVPGPVKHRRVRARAVAAFSLAADHRTTGATGVLIYLSRAERRAEIVADAAIAAKVAPEIWGEAMATMLAHIADGRLAEGVAAGIAKVGAVLAEHFPASAHDANQLPDGLIEL